MCARYKAQLAARLIEVVLYLFRTVHLRTAVTATATREATSGDHFHNQRCSYGILTRANEGVSQLILLNGLHYAPCHAEEVLLCNCIQ